MSKCLIDPEHGYYSKQDVFNTKGDFITSVEISQMFGEIVAVWMLHFLENTKLIDINNKQRKKDQPQLSLLEFGPGRGTLMVDVLRTFQQFDMIEGLEINFIEASPFNTKTQQENLQKFLQKHNIYLKYEQKQNSTTEVEIFSNENEEIYFQAKWFTSYEQFLMENYGESVLAPNSKPQQMKQNIQRPPIFVLAHEFFDAMPVNIFTYQQGQGWCEKLVNICHDSSLGKKFDWYTSEPNNEAVKKILKPEITFKNIDPTSFKQGDTIEIQPQSLIQRVRIFTIIKEIFKLKNNTELINKCDGASLIIDYGENQAFSNSVRGISKHKYIDQDLLLEFPGEIDLSAYVNFLHMQNAINKTRDVTFGGPIPQGLFLESMGMATRLDMLCKNSSKAQIKRLESEYLRLAAPEQMGSVYKFFYIGKKKHGQIFPFIEEEENQTYF